MNRLHVEEDIAQIMYNEYIFVLTFVTIYKISMFIVLDTNGKPELYIEHEKNYNSLDDFIDKIINEGVIHIYV